jgi:hypothetical protein
MPAVNAIASAHQNVTRNVALRTCAPPARAPIAPSSPRNTSDAIDTTGTSIDGGETRTTESGNTAPVAKVPADRQGRLNRTGGRHLRDAEFIPRMSAERVPRHQLIGDLSREVRFDAALDINQGEFLVLEGGRCQSKLA